MGIAARLATAAVWSRARLMEDGTARDGWAMTTTQT